MPPDTVRDTSIEACGLSSSLDRLEADGSPSGTEKRTRKLVSTFLQAQCSAVGLDPSQSFSTFHQDLDGVLGEPTLFSSRPRESYRSLELALIRC